MARNFQFEVEDAQTPPGFGLEYNPFQAVAYVRDGIPTKVCLRDLEHLNAAGNIQEYTKVARILFGSDAVTEETLAEVFKLPPVSHTQAIGKLNLNDK